MTFFRFPHTPHLTWLGKRSPRHDKVMSASEANELLARDVLVEEKVDGANVGFSIDANGILRAQNRGTYLEREHRSPQFRTLFRWLQTYEERLSEALFPSLMLFGEWCYATHSIRYSALPDWFLAFDVYDRATKEFWAADRRDMLVANVGLVSVPRLGFGRFSLVELRDLLGTSRLGSDLAEGLYVRADRGRRLVNRAKLVRPEFCQAIDEHWSRKAMQVNSLAQGRYPSQ